MNPPVVANTRRAYLVRAIYDWCLDRGHTPHLLVAADYPGVIVPKDFVREQRITLNISPMAVQNLDLKCDPFWFSARFLGKAMDVQIPPGAVLAIFAQENGEGLVFGEIEPPPSSQRGEAAKPRAEETPPTKPRSGGKSHLRVVK